MYAYSSAALSLLVAAAPLALAQSATSTSTLAAGNIINTNGGDPSSKRGLVYVPSAYTQDDNIWDQPNSDLTWYYNYGASPTQKYQGTKLQFVPMLWGAPSNPTTDMTFYNTVASQIKAGDNVTYVLGFNEPDGCSSGGSCVSAANAAAVWKKQMEPLKWQYGIKLGAPAMTGATTGFTWLQNFMAACAAINGNNTGCLIDFIPIHWYGNFEGLASHMGQVNGSYPNVTDMWVTEYAYADEDLTDSQSFYNTTAQYFDRLAGVSHYSYFGSFRSPVSNVGPNAAMLDQNGNLTDIGSWYLGGVATGNTPSASTSTSSGGGTTYSGKPYSAAGRTSINAALIGAAAVAASFVLA